MVLREQRRSLGVGTMIIGTAALGAGTGWLPGIDPLARLELVYIIEPLWLLWLSVVIWRRAGQGQPGLSAAPT
jgi:hypothetical protein